MIDRKRVEETEERSKTGLMKVPTEKSCSAALGVLKSPSKILRTARKKSVVVIEFT